MFKPLNTIRNSLNSVQDPNDPTQQRVAYMVSYSCGKPYISETSRPIKNRIKEHTIDINHNQVCSFALTQHFDKTKHQIQIENAKVLAKIEHYSKRKFREAIEIEKQPENINRDDGWTINKNWIPALHQSYESLGESHFDH
jgi:hypothetical protein